MSEHECCHDEGQEGCRWGQMSDLLLAEWRMRSARHESHDYPMSMAMTPRAAYGLRLLVKACIWISRQSMTLAVEPELSVRLPPAGNVSRHRANCCSNSWGVKLPDLPFVRSAILPDRHKLCFASSRSFQTGYRIRQDLRSQDRDQHLEVWEA